MLFFIALIVLLVIAFFVYLNDKKYKDFVRKNSSALKKVLVINQRYSFYPYIDFNQEHTYDNEKYYDLISCSDFLIYQLQFLRKGICDQVEKINWNRQQYQNYLDEINEIKGGVFQLPIGKLKREKLLERERLIVKKNIYQSPTMQFSIRITLYCSTMNGRIYDKKQQIFSAKEIFAFLQRLNNKQGAFYNDRGIWDSLCRVERGKVSNRMRFSIYERDGYRCRCCGVSGRYAKLEIDHIYPISKGGKTTYNNLQTLCHKCNYEKSNRLDY